MQILDLIFGRDPSSRSGDQEICGFNVFHVWPCNDLDLDLFDFQNLISYLSYELHHQPKFIIIIIFWCYSVCWFVRYRVNKLFGTPARTLSRMYGRTHSTHGRTTRKHNDSGNTCGRWRNKQVSTKGTRDPEGSEHNSCNSWPLYARWADQRAYFG